MGKGGELLHKGQGEVGGEESCDKGVRGMGSIGGGGGGGMSDEGREEVESQRLMEVRGGLIKGIERKAFD